MLNKLLPARYPQDGSVYVSLRNPGSEKNIQVASNFGDLKRLHILVIKFYEALIVKHLGELASEDMIEELLGSGRFARTFNEHHQAKMEKIAELLRKHCNSRSCVTDELR